MSDEAKTETPATPAMPAAATGDSIVEGGHELPGGFLEARITVQCLRCASVIVADIKNPSAADVRRTEDGVPEHSQVEVYEVKCETCSKELSDEAVVQLVILVGNHCASYLDAEAAGEQLANEVAAAEGEPSAG